MTQRRQLVTRSRALSSDNLEELFSRHREERKGAFGEIVEWNPALHRGSKSSKVFNKAYYYTPEPVRSSIKPPTSCEDWKSFFLIRIPIIQWLWSYKAKHLIGDIVAGLTIGMTHIPQGEWVDHSIPNQQQKICTPSDFLKIGTHRQTTPDQNLTYFDEM